MCFCSNGANGRKMLSVSPPAAHGMIVLIARSGYCAPAEVAKLTAQIPAATDKAHFFTTPSPWFVPDVLIGRRVTQRDSVAMRLTAIVALDHTRMQTELYPRDGNLALSPRGSKRCASRRPRTPPRHRRKSYVRP